MANDNCLEGVSCPVCKHDYQFEICGRATFEVTDSGSEAVGDHEWSDEDTITCSDCGHVGQLAEFKGLPRIEVTAPPAPVFVLARYGTSGGEVIGVYLTRELAIKGACDWSEQDLTFKTEEGLDVWNDHDDEHDADFEIESFQIETA